MYGMLWGERHGASPLPIFHQELYPQQEQQQREEEQHHPINVTANGLLISSNSNSSSNISSSSSSGSHSQSVLLSSKALKAVLSGSSNINSSSSSWEVAAAPPAATAGGQGPLPPQEHYHHHHHPQLLAIDSTARVISSSTGGGFAGEPTSVLDLRSPSPNNSRALDSASSSSAIKNTAIKKKASSSSSSDCNTTTNYSTTDAAKVKSKGDQQQQQQQQISSSLAQSSSSADEQQLQDELEQAVAVAAASGGYGLPLFYSSQGIRQMENYGGYDQPQQQQQQQHELLHQGRSDQWLLQDVVEAQQDDLLQHQQQQQQQQHGSHRLEEIASELLGSCPSPAGVVVPAESSSSFMRWLFEETSSAPPLHSSSSPAGGAAATGGDTNVLPAPPWQQQMMLMVKHEQQQQQQQQQQQASSSLSSSSLPPHLAHLESFTRRTLPLVSSGAPLFHHPHSMQFQDPLALNSGMNLSWQQQQQHHLQIGLEQQQPSRDPFLFGMIQDEQHQQHIPNLFGHSPSGSLLQASPASFHPGLFMENLGSHQGGLTRQTSRTPPFLEEQMLLRSQLPQQSHKREHQSGQQHHDLPHPSSKIARLSPPNSQPGHPPQHQHDSTSGVFPSRLLLHAAEACESGQEKLAQSILARLNDHHHHQLFLQQQEHHRSQQFHELHVPQARRIGLLFREILAERLSKRQAAPTSSSSSSSTAEAGIVERIAACKSLYDASNLLKCAHFIANQAISEAIESEECVHILDLSEAANSSSINSSFGCQWSSFVASTLQQKFSRPIKIRITLASSRQHALYFALESLKELARDHPNSGRCAEFEFCGVLTRPGNPLSLSDMGLKMHEALVVNFVLGLHKLVPVSEALESVRASNPKIVLLVEQEMEPAKPSFVERFREGLDYYTALAESIVSDENLLEDADKVEQLVWKSEIEELLAGNFEHQRLEKWKLWMSQAGFSCSRLSDMCEKIALGLFNFEKTGNNTKTRGFDLVRDDGSLLLGFRGKILASASAWKCC